MSARKTAPAGGMAGAAFRKEVFVIRLLRKLWRCYAPRPLDEVLADALYRGLRHDEATGHVKAGGLT